MLETGNIFIMKDIPVVFNRDELHQELRVKTIAQAEKLDHLIDEAVKIGNPQGLLKIAYIDKKNEDSISAEGIEFKSKILRENIGDSHRLFAYVATGGDKLEEWVYSFDDLLDQFYADKLSEKALGLVETAIDDYLKNNIYPGKIARMHPGSLPEWPIYEQKKLFALLQDENNKINVELSDSYLMKPIKSVSGIIFPTEKDFYSCNLCPRENCPGRRAGFDSKQYKDKISG